MPIIDFFRHGETVAPGVLAGRTDIALSDAGAAAVLSLTREMRWDGVVSSPRIRARQSADAVAARLGVGLDIDPRFAEIDLGLWDGRALSELMADAEIGPKLKAYYSDPSTLAPPDGETFQAFQVRVGDGVVALAKRPEAHLVCFAHAGSIRAAMAHALAIPFAKLWGVRIAYATRVRLNLGYDESSGVWGEILEIAQP